MLRFVPDVSAVCAWCFEDERTAASEALLARLPECELCIPALFLWELGNVLLMAERRGRISSADRSRFLALVVQLDLGIDPADPQVVWHDVLGLASQHRLTSYDAAYLELAMRGGLPLASRDNALMEAARTCGLELLAC
ncbi:type II toxin-antitoxin system VapC family toxin [Synechococcus sp. BA-132 BA5]|uniref:type II toxin-antitoxin system VapC family toxin n=1 Tax=Synechococcus sp. BA-132 BA5 TaxID=3110252 RepID=UPI002B1F10BD|nr:type II toxin-antitoxin system VapC family toxin [Synechococcus sp. BA-132 BA5]MEA5417076.1 type II toxin-antitoxin system VapC family toxin [Synechococcus sp. BA-132 BA5]